MKSRVTEAKPRRIGQWRGILLVCWLSGVLATLLWLSFHLMHPATAAAAPQPAPSAVCDTVQVISQLQCEALVAFYNSTGGDAWISKTNWLQTDTPCSDWYGIRCFQGTVADIILPTNNLTGTLPPEMADLSNLLTLNLRSNNLTGTLPLHLETLTSLRGIDLGSNHFTGDISSIPWGNFVDLYDLRLDNNQLTGSIPPEFGQLTDLAKLHLWANDLAGPIPSTFGASCNNGVGGMCQLQELLLGGQGPKLSGTLPASLGNLTSLLNFNISSSNITGTIPSSFQNLTNMVYFSATDNNLHGSLAVFSAMTKLQELRLAGNFFTGTIPSSLGNLTNLKRLHLMSNQLSGPVPAEVACPPDFTEFWLAENMLYVDDEAAAACIAALGGLGHQTVPPADIRRSAVTEQSVELAWSAIVRGAQSPGYYEIGWSQSPDDLPSVWPWRTPNQATENFSINDLDPGTDYYFFLRTYTPAFGQQKNALRSLPSQPPIMARTLGEAPALTFTKEVTPTVASPGQAVTYTLTLLSSKPMPAVQLTDTLPVSVTFDRFVEGSGQVAGQQIASIVDVPANTPVTIRYHANVAADALGGSILFSKASASDNGQKSYIAAASVAVPIPQPIETLFLIYTSGDNNLASPMQELFQKAEAANLPQGAVALLLYDGPGQGDTFYYRLKHDTNRSENCPTQHNFTCSGRYVEHVDVWPWAENVGTYTSLKEFLIGAMTAYPARTVVLSLVGHGSGWSPNILLDQPSTHDEKPDNQFWGGILWDETPESALSTAQLGLALKESVAATGQTFDLLYLDACLMSMAEVAYEVAGSVDYLLASESTSWTSFRYDLHLSWSVAPHDARTIGKKWIDNEVSELKRQTGVDYPYTYALLDLTGDHAQQLVSLTSQLSTALSDVLKDGTEETKKKISDAITTDGCFDSNQDHVINKADYYCDLYRFSEQLLEQFSAASNGREQKVISATQQLRDFLDVDKRQFTLYQRTNSAPNPRYPGPSWNWGKLGGVSIYLPIQKDDWKRRYYSSAYLKFTVDGTWQNFIDAYWSSSPPQDPPKCEINCVPQPPDPVVAPVYLPLIVTH